MVWYGQEGKVSQGHKTGVQGIVIKSAEVKPKVWHVKPGLTHFTED